LLFDVNRKRQTTIVVATHDEKVVEVADTLYTISDGKLKLEN